MAGAEERFILEGMLIMTESQWRYLRRSARIQAAPPLRVCR
jgi:hypothetical protein